MTKIERLPRELKALARRIEQNPFSPKRADGTLSEEQLKAAEKAGILTRTELSVLPKLRALLQRQWKDDALLPAAPPRSRDSAGLGSGIAITGPSAPPRSRRAGDKPANKPRARVLVIDISGSAVKLSLPDGGTKELPSGPTLTPQELIKAVRDATVGAEFDVVAIGYPGVVKKNKVATDSHHLAPGWIGYDFKGALGRPVKLVNDAAMQALGSVTEVGVTLFIGVGTGLGVALVHSEKGADGELKRRVISTELGHAHSATGGEYESLLKQAEAVGADGALSKQAFKEWTKSLRIVVDELRQLFHPDQVVIGGSQIERFDNISEMFPDCTIITGDRAFADLGGRALWLGDV
jgi:polyphosphate glucokinase